jgi:hypothetical protein
MAASGTAAQNALMGGGSQSRIEITGCQKFKEIDSVTGNMYPIFVPLGGPYLLFGSVRPWMLKTWNDF